MPTGRSPERTRVFLHVGSPKTGTTFLQNVLWSQRERAREQGLLLPLGRFHDHFLATLDVRGLAGRDPHPPQAVGSWDRVAAEALDWPGSVLISHELFAGATGEQASRAVASLTGRAEVHVVVTARDLVRQLTAEWQEHVKHRSTRTLAEFVKDVRDDTDRTSWFWRVQDFAGVAQRWGADLPASRVHVVTVPPSGGRADLLWERFAGLLGLDPGSFDTAASRSNTSLGVEQAELLRRVNVALGDRLPMPGPYPAVVKDVLAHQLLADRRGTPIRLTADDVDRAVDSSRAIADRLTAMGVDVVGDLDELVPARDEVSIGSDAGYAAPSAESVADEGVAALADLLVELSRRSTALRRQRERLELAERRPVRFALTRGSERHRALMAARALYRRLPGRRR
jgi:hypothetical protein